MRLHLVIFFLLASITHTALLADDTYDQETIP